VPWFDNSYTKAQLGYAPRDLRRGLQATVEWLGQLSEAAGRRP
jgi:hypothetical protein